jgi:hypothetical protein
VRRSEREPLPTEQAVSWVHTAGSHPPESASERNALSEGIGVPRGGWPAGGRLPATSLLEHRDRITGNEHDAVGWLRSSASALSADATGRALLATPPAVVGIPPQVHTSPGFRAECRTRQATMAAGTDETIAAALPVGFRRVDADASLAVISGTGISAVRAGRAVSNRWVDTAAVLTEVSGTRIASIGTISIGAAGSEGLRGVGYARDEGPEHGAAKETKRTAARPACRQCPGHRIEPLAVHVFLLHARGAAARM